MTSWVDTSGNLWLFGGRAIDITGTLNHINDLWKYDISLNEWTWMNGSNSVLSIGYYGSILVASATNCSPARSETNASWTDSNNNLWLFGGNSEFGLLNDLWKYNIASNEWTWMKGPNILNQ